MEYYQEPYRVCVKVDENGCVIAVNSSAFLTDNAEWTEIDSGYGDAYQHAQNNYLPQPIMDERGVYRYRLDGGTVVERNREEMDADFAARPAPNPTAEELLLEIAGDQEYRLCLMELGVSDSDL